MQYFSIHIVSLSKHWMHINSWRSFVLCVIPYIIIFPSIVLIDALFQIYCYLKKHPPSMSLINTISTVKVLGILYLSETSKLLIKLVVSYRTKQNSYHMCDAVVLGQISCSFWVAVMIQSEHVWVLMSPRHWVRPYIVSLLYAEICFMLYVSMA